MKNSAALTKNMIGHIGKTKASERIDESKIHDRVHSLAGILVSNLFPILSTYYPDFESKNGGLEHHKLFALAKEYAHRLIIRSVSKKGLSIGIERVKAESIELRWSPNPEQFARLCEPTAEQMGIPNLEDAKEEIIKARGIERGRTHVFSHDLTHELNRMHGYDMYSMSDKLWTEKLKHAYDRLFKMAVGGTLTRQAPAPGIELKYEQSRPTQENDVYLNDADPLMRRVAKLREQANKGSVS